MFGMVLPGSEFMTALETEALTTEPAEKQYGNVLAMLGNFQNDI